MKYTLIEKQNANSVRAGYPYYCDSLTQAKKAASRMRMFQGTVLIIEQGGRAVAIKSGNKWENV